MAKTFLKALRKASTGGDSWQEKDITYYQLKIIVEEIHRLIWNAAKENRVEVFYKIDDLPEALIMTILKTTRSMKIGAKAWNDYDKVAKKYITTFHFFWGNAKYDTPFSGQGE